MVDCARVEVVAMVALPSPRRPDAGSRWQGTWRWHAAEPMHQAREGHTATLLDDGRVLVAGGVAAPDGFMTSAEIFDPWDRSWSRAACLRQGRTGHTATRLANGTVMVVGGAAEGGSLASVEVYDPVDDRWSELPPMATPRALHAALRLAGGHVVCTGGADLRRVPPVRLASVEIYDPALDLWTRAATMACGRAAHSATLLEDDAVLITGGEGHGEPPQAAEVYLAGMDRWRQTLGSNATPARHSATRLVDGSVLLAGGCSSGAVATVRRYCPARRTFLCQAEMPGHRRSHTAPCSRTDACSSPAAGTAADARWTPPRSTIPAAMRGLRRGPPPRGRRTPPPASPAAGSCSPAASPAGGRGGAPWPPRSSSRSRGPADRSTSGGETMRQPSVLVMGGGVAGMSAAHELAERGFRVTVLERRAIPGGKARSVPVPHTGTAGRRDLPGEHGFRFFPGFYRHLPDTMRRIPLPGRPNGVFDNLVPATRLEMARAGMRKVVIPARFPTSLEELRMGLA